MENINEPNSDVGISTGKSDEVNLWLILSTFQILLEVKIKHSGICHG